MAIVPFQPSMQRQLFLWLIAKALIVTGIILYAGIGLSPDEAQYWTWSQVLDWGYYSKPPGIAWQIWLGTHLFGQTEWGVRSASVLLSLAQAWLMYHLALQAGLLTRTAFWCSLLLAFSPLGILGSFFAITDVGFLLCWTGACLTTLKAFNQKQAPSPLQLGGWIIAGALFKWPIYLLWPFVLCCFHWFFPHQKKRPLILGALISLLGFLPSIWWNLEHDWATFRHVFATLQGGSGQRAAGNTIEFLGSQAMLLSPLIFILLLMALWHWLQQRQQLTPALFFCGFVTSLSLGGFTILSFFQKIQGNWIIFAYPTGIVLLGWDAFQTHPSRQWWAKMGMGISLLLISSLILLSTFSLPYRFNPFKHQMGWQNLAPALTQLNYDPHQHFLFSDKYQTASILSFYGPEYKRAYFLNLLGMRQNQFSYWPSLHEERCGQTGYFVGIENSPRLERTWQEKREFYQSTLAHYFKEVEFLAFIPLLGTSAAPLKGALIFRCHDCQERQLPRSHLY